MQSDGNNAVFLAEWHKTGCKKRTLQAAECAFVTDGKALVLVFLFLVLFVFALRAGLVEDAAQEDADKVEQHHGDSYHALGHDVRRGDDSCDEEDEHDGNAPGLFKISGLAMPILERMMVTRGISNTQPKMMNMVRQRLT